MVSSYSVKNWSAVPENWTTNLWLSTLAMQAYKKTHTIYLQRSLKVMLYWCGLWWRCEFLVIGLFNIQILLLLLDFQSAVHNWFDLKAFSTLNSLEKADVHVPGSQLTSNMSSCGQSVQTWCLINQYVNNDVVLDAVCRCHSYWTVLLENTHYASRLPDNEQRICCLSSWHTVRYNSFTGSVSHQDEPTWHRWLA